MQADKRGNSSLASCSAELPERLASGNEMKALNGSSYYRQIWCKAHRRGSRGAYQAPEEARPLKNLAMAM